jgi:hypothetical protein
MSVYNASIGIIRVQVEKNVGAILGCDIRYSCSPNYQNFSKLKSQGITQLSMGAGELGGMGARELGSMGGITGPLALESMGLAWLSC